MKHRRNVGHQEPSCIFQKKSCEPAEIKLDSAHACLLQPEPMTI